jgi:glycerate kinase
MRVLIAPDKFKGCLPATAVAAHLAAGLADAGVESVSLPLADGGDGSIAAALAAGFSAHTVSVSDALGRPRASTIAVRDDTAVVEIADTCGLSTLPGGVLAPYRASSSGFGQAIRQALDLGARRLVLALGGSASTDGGTGMLDVLGYRFLDRTGRALPASAEHLNRVHHIDRIGAVDLTGVDVVVATDVTNPLTGPSGAAAVFGPQKGASPADIAQLEAGLAALVAAARRSGWEGADTLARTDGAGAAGGCGFAALLMGATVTSGAEYFLDLLEFDHRLAECQLVITGEGRLDSQTLFGKLPAAIAARAAQLPVIAVVGRNDLGADPAPFAGIYAVADLADSDTSTDPEQTALLLRRIGAQLTR